MLSIANFCNQYIRFFMYYVHKSIYLKILRSAKKFKDFILKYIKSYQFAVFLSFVISS